MFQRHTTALHRVFAIYAARDKSTAHARARTATLNEAEWVLLLRDCQLLGGALLEPQARQVFNSVRKVSASLLAAPPALLTACRARRRMRRRGARGR